MNRRFAPQQTLAKFLILSSVGIEPTLETQKVPVLPLDDELNIFRAFTDFLKHDSIIILKKTNCSKAIKTHNMLEADSYLLTLKGLLLSRYAGLCFTK